ncbi:TetR/AcrR family transcriptional regulator [Lactiplantibacillus fabifermentans]|uniref:HTH tetR-type domain-containing protein n=2 Tax=Lactiplantibacillus fabifermentans TaxID=483011 RepID=A0A0R2NRF7_9LACO|nr:TetR/AcrR family transcriptional regulator [Lactiplantibacillus fabifermentans]ETY74371.1 TetR family transcriptional regulator [Lactiplantibacillus fabifermentans T30PCM01]KRO28265.1 hypothetical protein DY78_GL002501 [Lactiplantibacillus fabifermentans DSM 21115]
MKNTDQRVVKTLALIDQTCYALLDQMPFEKLSVAMICKHATIGRSTFYQYYLDKYDWLEKQVALYTDQFQTIMANRQRDFQQSESLTKLVTALLPYRAPILVLLKIHSATADLTVNFNQILQTSVTKFKLPDSKLTVPLPYLQALYATNAMTYITYSLEHGIDEQVSQFMNQSFNLILPTLVVKPK